jgi:O-antigen/teichoic acid export membrane protein
MNCKIPVILAYAMAAYSISSMLYIFTTIFTQTGTPLSDKINKDPELKKIREKSKHDRGMIFFCSFLIAVIFLYFVKPFHSCYDFSNNQELFLTNTF